MNRNFFEASTSPCINICKYDISNNYCTGCFRTPAEISKWFYLSEEERSKITESLDSRKNEFNN